MLVVVSTNLRSPAPKLRLIDPHYLKYANLIQRLVDFAARWLLKPSTKVKTSNVKEKGRESANKNRRTGTVAKCVAMEVRRMYDGCLELVDDLETEATVNHWLTVLDPKF